MYNKLLELSSIPNIEIYIDTNWLLLNSMGENLNISDVMIRYLAVKEFYDKGSDYVKQKLAYLGDNITESGLKKEGLVAFSLYYKMQKTRAEYIIKYAKLDPIDSIKHFIKLLDSVKENGFVSDFPIEINKNFCLLDGAHRFAIALFLKLKKVRVFFGDGVDFNPDYSIDWFLKSHLKTFVPIIEKTYIDLLKRYSTMYLITVENGKELDKTKFDKYYIEICDNIDKYNWILINNNAQEKVGNKFILIPKFNEEIYSYPKFYSLDNKPILLNDNRSKLINYCNQNDLGLYIRKE